MSHKWSSLYTHQQEWHNAMVSLDVLLAAALGLGTGLYHLFSIQSSIDANPGLSSLIRFGAKAYLVGNLLALAIGLGYGYWLHRQLQHIPSNQQVRLINDATGGEINTGLAIIAVCNGLVCSLSFLAIVAYGFWIGLIQPIRHLFDPIQAISGILIMILAIKIAKDILPQRATHHH